MIYECQACGATLPAGAVTCPKCNQIFDEPVPQDADAPMRGWQTKTLSDPSLPSPTPVSTAAPGSLPSVNTSADPASLADPASSADPITSGNPDREYWEAKAQQSKTAAQKIISGLNKIIAATPLKSARGRFGPLPQLLAAGACLCVIIGLVALIQMHMNAYVFNQHPMYEANMASFTDVARQREVDYIWPYEGHEDRLHVIYHTDSYGSTTSEIPSKHDLDIFAIAGRLGFCAIRYRSGFTPREAMQCQTYVSFENTPSTSASTAGTNEMSSDTGYDGPEVAPSRDSEVEGRLNEIQ